MPETNQTEDGERGSEEDFDAIMDDSPEGESAPGKKEAEESSSQGSTSEEKTSGGGYSADCSSEDDTGRGTALGLDASVSALNLSETSSEVDGNADEIEAEVSMSTRIPADKKLPTAVSRSEHRPKKRTEESRKRSSDKPKRNGFLIQLLEEKRRRSKESSSRGRGGAAEASESSFDIAGSCLPQWNGVKVRHPMDPRIDLSTVQLVAQAPLPGPLTTPNPDSGTGDSEKKESSEDIESHHESYARLLEVIRPFFNAQGVKMAVEGSTAEAAKDSNSEPVSSEGFTSFFTTTHSGSGSGNSGWSDLDKKLPAVAHRPKEDEGNTDASSMAVLARIKKKHTRKRRDGESSLSSTEKRVRIQEGHVSERREEDRNTGVEQPPDSGESDPANESSITRSSESSSSPEGRINGGEDGAGVDEAAALAAVEPNGINRRSHVVTDVSSSNRTDSNASSSNNGTSGSGSGGNSGSNQGSSGSGNEKGSSEDAPKDEEEVGSSDVANGPDRVDGKQPASNKNLPLHQHHPRHDPTRQQENERSETVDIDDDRQSTREKKLQDKKRKRIEMRREYEAQQHFESSESSNGASETLLRPGRPVSMDLVLAFSRIPRIIVQATPPFLVVHTNAAYSRLTGAEAHRVVGKTIKSLLSIPRLKNPPQGTTDGAVPPQESGNEIGEETGLERLVAASGFGHIQFVNAIAEPHQMLGRNVTIVRDNAQGEASKDDRSNGTSISSTEGQGQPLIPCRTAIAPIVSSQHSYDHGDVEHRAKRHKSQDDNGPNNLKDINQHRKHRQFVSHYVIQLEPQGQSTVAKQDCENSISSNTTSIEAGLVGLSKQELRRQRAAVDSTAGNVPPEAEGSSDSSETKDPVSAVG